MSDNNTNIIEPLVNSLWECGAVTCKLIGKAIETIAEKRTDKAHLPNNRDSEATIVTENVLRFDNKRILDFNDLFENCSLRNKQKELPTLEKYRHLETVDIYSFRLPVGVTVSAVREKLEQLSDFFEVEEMNVKVQKKKGLMDIIITKDSIFNRVFDYRTIELQGGLKIPLGHYINQDYLEKLLVIDMSKDEIPHGFIGSTTGGGKSNFLRVMLLNWIMNLSTEELELYLIDGKGGTDYMSFVHAPHVFMNKCFQNKEDIVTILQEAIAEILSRNQTFIDAKVNNFKEYTEMGNRMAHRVIVFDEYAVYHGEQEFSTIQSLVGKICSTGRSAGVHIIVASQDSRKEVLDSMIKYNMPLKIGFKCGNAQHSKNISGYEGLETIRTIGVGRAYGLPVDTEYIQFKTMKAPSSEKIRQLIVNKYR